jgi:hypothetical protein
VAFAGSDHKQCVIGRNTGSSMIVMTKTARLDLLVIHHMYAPCGVRCCSSHLIQCRRLRPDEVIKLGNRRQLPAPLSLAETQELISDLLALLQEAISSPHLHLLDSSLSGEDNNVWTGCSKTQFDQMFDVVSPSLRSSINRHARNAFGLFWVKLKTN